LDNVGKLGGEEAGGIEIGISTELEEPRFEWRVLLLKILLKLNN
jgi:hypothetical protein